MHKSHLYFWPNILLPLGITVFLVLIPAGIHGIASGEMFPRAPLVGYASIGFFTFLFAGSACYLPVFPSRVFWDETQLVRRHWFLPLARNIHWASLKSIQKSSSWGTLHYRLEDTEGIILKIYYGPHIKEGDILHRELLKHAAPIYRTQLKQGLQKEGINFRRRGVWKKTSPITITRKFLRYGNEELALTRIQSLQLLQTKSNGFVAGEMIRIFVDDKLHTSFVGLQDSDLFLLAFREVAPTVPLLNTALFAGEKEAPKKKNKVPEIVKTHDQKQQNRDLLLGPLLFLALLYLQRQRLYVFIEPGWQEMTADEKAIAGKTATLLALVFLVIVIGTYRVWQRRKKTAAIHTNT